VKEAFLIYHIDRITDGEGKPVYNMGFPTVESRSYILPSSAAVNFKPKNQQLKTQ